MTAALRGEQVAKSELPSLAALLAADALPVSDLDQEGRLFWRFRDADGVVVGIGGLELYGADALLRSVVVSRAQRSHGYGRAVVAALTAEAAARGTRRVFLLTAGAADFFAALGFTVLSRDAVPPAIAATREFAALCPASAVCMTKALGAGP